MVPYAVLILIVLVFSLVPAPIKAMFISLAFEALISWLYFLVFSGSY